ncbi:hypothetical protein V7200_05680 [Cytobacillus firmus]|uniref:Flagellar protein FlbD n=1 Tax=Cytobacillus firmus TaxID=1399 RepID=A0A800NFQ8_CYTFI|nr:hypothetical protein [Cytobacillus firmus]KAF0825763.1 hypothetical protein KIS1582_0436 [Cytobacillus firmus]
MTTKPVNFLNLKLTNGNAFRIKRTSILAMEEKSNCTIVYFQSGTVRVLETIADIERMIFI